jgi:hypothetical protein
VRWMPACEDVSSEGEERPLLEHVTNEMKTVTQNTNLFVIVIRKL